MVDLKSEASEKTKPVVKPAPPPPPVAPPYKPMDTCPKIVGKSVRLFDGKNWIDAKWTVTRSYSSTDLRWIQDSYWMQGTWGGRIHFEPVGWEEKNEY